MLFKLAWRNIRRNKRRSIIVLLSVIVGVNAMLFMDGMSSGMLSQILFNQISLNVSHIQVHNNGFNDNKVVQNVIDNPGKVEEVLTNNNNIIAYSKRVITFGLLSSATNSTGVYISGINPESDKLAENVIIAGYLHDICRDEKNHPENFWKCAN